MAFEMAGWSDRPTAEPRDDWMVGLSADLWADWMGARKAASTACLKAEKSANCLVCETVGHWGATMVAWSVYLSADQRAALRVGSWA